MTGSPLATIDLAESFLLAFMPQSVGLSIHPVFAGVSSWRECNGGQKVCQRDVQEPPILRDLQHAESRESRKIVRTLRAENTLQNLSQITSLFQMLRCTRFLGHFQRA